MKVINLFGEPCAGKSRTAMSLASLMKSRGISVELVTEYAKDCVWEDRAKTLNDQYYISAKQNHRLERLRGKVEYVVTDSPLIFGILYSRDSSRFPSFHQLIMEIFNSYQNFNVLLNRQHAYVQEGRIQTEEEAEVMRRKLIEVLHEKEVPFLTMNTDQNTPSQILAALQRSPLWVPPQTSYAIH